MNLMTSTQLIIPFDAPLAQGVFNGIKWRSGTRYAQAQVDYLQWLLNKHNLQRIKDGMEVEDLPTFVNKRFRCLVADWLRLPFDRFKYYESKSKYRNGVCL